MPVNLENEKLKDPDFLIRFFKSFGYANFNKRSTYLTFSRDEGSNPTSIVAYFDKKNAIIRDHPRDIEGNLISFFLKQGYKYGEIVKRISQIAGGGIFTEDRSPGPFCGFFDEMFDLQQSEYPEPIDRKVLEQYEPLPNRRFLNDGISLKAQKTFEIGYEPERNIITIPLYDEDGNLVGVKGRINREPKEGEGKYIHLHPCSARLLLYGFYQNYMDLENAKRIYVFEAEKSVMQAWSMGYRNCVAIGTSAISQRQCEMLLYLRPEEVVFMLDSDIPEEVVKRSCIKLFSNDVSHSLKIRYWKAPAGYPEKTAPTDLGKKRFERSVGGELYDYAYE